MLCNDLVMLEESNGAESLYMLVHLLGGRESHVRQKILCMLMRSEERRVGKECSW